MEHLALEIFDITGTGSSYATLAGDASITITDTSEIFASGDVWSYSFTLNTRANAHIFGTSGEIHGSRLHEQLDKRRARLWVEGLPLYFGHIRLADEAEVDEEGDIEVTFEGGRKTFEDMIEGAKANQVPMMGDVLIGMALWRKRWVRHWMKLQASTVFSDGTRSDWSDVGSYSTAHGHDGDSTSFECDGEEDGSSLQQYPRMVFPKGDFYDLSSSDSSDSGVYENENGSFGGESSGASYPTESVDCINTDYPYDAAHPYCNIALCYQRYGYEKKKEENGSIVTYNDYGGEPEAQRGYEYMPANRVNSAPNFYVIYWINALMKHLGIHIEENQMTDVEDLRRLFFVNTNCAYEEPDYLRTVAADERFGKYRFKGGNIGLGRFDSDRLVAEYLGPEGSYGNGHTGFLGPQRIVKIEECGFTGNNIQGADSPTLDEGVQASEVPDVERVLVKIKSVEGWTSTEKKEYERKNSYLHKAYASSDCFPDADISEVIRALESGFGIRFLFSDSYQRVRIVLLRNIFRGEEVQEIACDIVSDTKTENCVRGFRMTYGDSDDTAFYYKGFADMLPHIKDLWQDTSDKHDYSHWKLDAAYGDIIQKVSAFDKTCYVTPQTGNAYGIKIDKDAKRYDELHPSLFEYAGFMDAEDGDCTGEEETIETVTVGFTPAVMNDLNMDAERNDGVREQRFALFVDEKMRPRRPDLNTGVDYNDPDALYEVDKLYAKTDKKYEYEGMMADEIVKPGEFAVTSDMYAMKDGVSASVKKLIKYVDVASGDSYESIPLYATWNFTMGIDGHVNEGYRLYLQDNFEPNDDGVSPVETHDWGLTLGIMRGSGSDAFVEYTADDRDGEGNDTWDIVPGSSATAHPDVCDSFGNEFDYDGSYTVTPAGAAAKLAELFPDSDAPFNDGTLGYITGTKWGYWTDSSGNRHVVLMASEYSIAGTTITGSGDIRYFVNLTLEELIAESATRHFIIEVDSSVERGKTLLQLCRMAYGGDTESMVIDNGVGSRYGRFSLKLRAEKLNPYYDPSRPEGSSNRRYLAITDENLRGRGLCDTFYKEYSYWKRNARIISRQVRMTLAQLLAIDKTKKVTVGDVTGFVRKMQYTVSNSGGLGMVTMEIMYI